MPITAECFQEDKELENIEDELNDFCNETINFQERGNSKKCELGVEAENDDDNFIESSQTWEIELSPYLDVQDDTEVVPSSQDYEIELVI